MSAEVEKWLAYVAERARVRGGSLVRLRGCLGGKAARERFFHIDSQRLEANPRSVVSMTATEVWRFFLSRSKESYAVLRMKLLN